MKCLTITVVAGAVSFALDGGCASGRAVSSGPPGAACCCALPAGSHASVGAGSADALGAALQDERRAQAFYASVVAEHGRVRPFANIVQAEERHAAAVAALMDRHGVAAPPADLAGLPPVPATLRECSAAAAGLERGNIAMYDRLLRQVQEPDIRAAFENLRSASRDNHLPAFERWAAGSTGPGWGGRGGNGLAGLCRGPCGINP